eukprot:Hpha_TRINITY_DN35900_c0_g1::TRINITY_DN35900_c0_g1_i1::g.184940::m.184940
MSGFAVASRLTSAAPLLFSGFSLLATTLLAVKLQQRMWARFSCPILFAFCRFTFLSVGYVFLLCCSLSAPSLHAQTGCTFFSFSFVPFSHEPPTSSTWGG